ncbi:MAG: 4-hydroxy-tetrahydrodipicolinate reductase [Rikenellaceae bacterium]|nr:4-hydroxy-tetrahydrodipicolinate reductase [Rikenellaceae bacterium]
MRTVIIGYGKMGREIEAILAAKGHRVVLIIDEDNAGELNTSKLHECGAEVALEFTTPQTAYGNIIACLEAGVGVVSGTTGWLEMLPEVEKLCREKGGAFFYASNYSVGVNIFFRVNRALAGMMERFDQYDVTVEEIHHTMKKDAPSGTAITLAEGILDNLSRKRIWVGNTTTDPRELEVVAVRRGTVPGTHTVTYDSPEDSIEIKHTAKGRTGFAAGAVMAAEFICGKQGIYTMDDLLGF